MSFSASHQSLWRVATIAAMFIAPLGLVGLLVLGIWLGGPARPPAMASINNPFKSVDFSQLPALFTYVAKDGAALGYRAYAPVGSAPLGSVVLVHGSSASSHSMHPMAHFLSSKGYKVFALDLRGHGVSGAKGHIAYIGQLEDDLAAFVQAVKPPTPSTLLGFSSGGGFALRVAGGSNQTLFDNYALLAPFISQDAATYRPRSGGWANVGVPRIIALSILNGMGITALNHLPVTSFALNDAARDFLTPEYDFNLATNFRPQRDFEANIKAVQRPVAVLAGAADEAFFTDQFAPLFKRLGKPWPVTLLEGIGHIPLTLEPRALEATATLIATLLSATPSKSTP